MMHGFSRVAIAAAGLTLSLGSTAQAFTMATTPLTPEQGGYVYCKVVVTSTRPIGITAGIIDASGTNVTDFGSSWRVSPSATADGRYYAEETAGAFNAGYCRASIKGALRRDVQEMSLSVFGQDGTLITTVAAQ